MKARTWTLSSLSAGRLGYFAGVQKRIALDTPSLSVKTASWTFTVDRSTSLPVGMSRVWGLGRGCISPTTAREDCSPCGGRATAAWGSGSTQVTKLCPNSLDESLNNSHEIDVRISTSPFFYYVTLSKCAPARRMRKFAHAHWARNGKLQNPASLELFCINFYLTNIMIPYLTLARFFLGLILCYCAAHGLPANRRNWFYPAFQQQNQLGAECVVFDDHPCNAMFNRTESERYAKFPNSRGMTMEGSRKEFMQYYTLFNLRPQGCYLEMWSLLCFHYFPQCSPGLPLRFIVTPCRETCQRARTGCDDFLRDRNISWPEHLDCARFNSSHEDHLCVNRSAVELGSLPSPTPTSESSPTSDTISHPTTEPTTQSTTTTTSAPTNTPQPPPPRKEDF